MYYPFLYVQLKTIPSTTSQQLYGTRNWRTRESTATPYVPVQPFQQVRDATPSSHQ